MALKEEGVERITAIVGMDVDLIEVMGEVDNWVLRSRLQTTAIPR